MISTAATATISLDDARAWLAEHGVDLGEVLTAVIRVDRDVRSEHIGAWLDVTFYLLNERGERFIDQTRDEGATGHATIPLASFPRLTPAEGP